MKKTLITTAIGLITLSSSFAQSWGFTLGNGVGFAYSRGGNIGWGGSGGYWRGGSGYYNNYQPTYIAPQYYVAPYGVTWQQRCATPGPIIVPSYNSYRNNTILMQPFK